MKILWVTNVLLPEASTAFGLPASPYGGWLIGARNALVMQPNVELAVLSPSAISGRLAGLRSVGGVDYHLFGGGRHREMQIASVMEQERPDLVHVFGTEFAHSAEALRAADKLGLPSVLSLQGLVGQCGRYFLSGVPWRVQHGWTVRDALRLDNPWLQRAALTKRSVSEADSLRLTKHVIGRTRFDQAHSAALNPNARYWHLFETLRPSFYEGNWDRAALTQSSVFMSQGSTPLKGLHRLLQALALVKLTHPNIHVRVAGAPMSRRGRFWRSRYAVYIDDLIRDLDLGRAVTFLGELDEGHMASELRAASLYVLPSSIENSPNSLGEAMLQGTPCVAANVGGVSSLVHDRVEAILYQYDDIVMLASAMMDVLENPTLAFEISENARISARRTHDPDRNNGMLLNIYNDIVGVRR